MKTYQPTSMYFNEIRKAENIVNRNTLKGYWCPQYNEYVSDFAQNHDGYSAHYKIVFRNQITGKLVTEQGYNKGNIQKTIQKNVYGMIIYSTTESLKNNGFRWIANLSTYIHQDDIDAYFETEKCITSGGKDGIIVRDIEDFDSDFVWSGDEEVYIHDDQTREVRGRIMSIRRFEESYFNCESCGDDYHNNDYGSDGRCVGCDDSNSDSPDRSSYEACAVIAYGFYNGKGKNNKVIEGARYFGLEIEIELDSSDDVGELRNRLEDKNLALGCEDGSLSSDWGLEIKTPPMLSGHYREYLERVYAIVQEYDYGVNDSCGLHVNVSRSSVTNLTIGKLQCFLHNPKNRDFIRMIANRDSGQWADWKRLRDMKSHLNNGRAYNSPDKYQACNVQDYVLEFRLFKSVKSIDGAIRGIEFCDALINFCTEIPVQEVIKSGITHERFKSWLFMRKKWFPVLSEYLFGKFDGQLNLTLQQRRIK